MAAWNVVDMIANALTGGNIQKMKNTQRGFEQQGQGGVIPSAQASPMQPKQPSLSGPADIHGDPGPIRTADNVGHGIPGPSPGHADAFLRQLFGKSTLPQAGTRGQMFADYPQSGYDPMQRRY